MSTAAQICANRENSKLNTGPRTAEGKAGPAAITSFTVFAQPTRSCQPRTATNSTSWWDKSNPTGHPLPLTRNSWSLKWPGETEAQSNPAPGDHEPEREERLLHHASRSALHDREGQRSHR